MTPAPTIPASELLGDLLMEQKHAGEALAAYRRSLELYPRRFNTLLGAARAAQALGDKQAASDYYRQLLEVASPATRRSSLAEAREYR